MILYPPAKINLGLRIIRKRQDGFHDLESLFYPVPLYDILEIIPSEGNNDLFTQSGLILDGDKSDNLVMKAVRMMRETFGIPPLNVHLHKIIPAGAGLGGGSSDAAFCIKMINSIFNLNLSVFRMKELASALGSDCAFFVDPQPSIATGRGEVLESFHLSLKGLSLVIIIPEIYISTAEAYKEIEPEVSKTDFKELLKLSPYEWKGKLANDFEKSIFIKNPVLPSIKAFLYSENAVYASMSGSGSAIYGLFRDDINVECFFMYGHMYILRDL